MGKEGKDSKDSKGGKTVKTQCIASQRRLKSVSRASQRRLKSVSIKRRIKNKMEKYKNKYRIKSARHPHWDYGNNGLYFITICTKNRKHFFGEIVTDNNGLPSVSLSKIGKIVETEWLKTFDMRPDMNLWMGEFVVMPNHFHAIIGIGDNVYNTVCDEPNNESKNKFGPQSKNLPSIVRGFKIGVTKNARQITPDFMWQPRYHDHIIRNDKSFYNISNYIEQNPLNWKKDKFYE